MRAVIQLVSRAAVDVDGETISSIDNGLLVLLGVAQDDGRGQARLLAEKIANLRIFPDGEGRMNVSLLDKGYAMLVVSQFTLLADCRKGRRPSYNHAAPPAAANSLYEAFMDEVRALGITVHGGRFQAMMRVSLCNEGPVTIVLDTDQLGRR